MRRKVLSLCLVMALCLSTLFVCGVSASADENMLTDGALRTAETAGYFGGQGTTKITWVDAQGASGGNGYVEVTDRPINYEGAFLNLGTKLEGVYTLEFQIKTKNPGTMQQMRITQRTDSGSFDNSKTKTISVGDSWQKIEYKFTVVKGAQTTIYFIGNMSAENDKKDFCLDDLVLTAVPGSTVVKVEPKNASSNVPVVTVISSSVGTVEEEASDTSNYLAKGKFDSIEDARVWSVGGGQKAEGVFDGKGVNGSLGYMKFSNIMINYVGFQYKLGFNLPAGSYRFTGSFKTADKDSVTQLRAQILDASANSVHTTFTVNVGDAWMTITGYFTVKDGESVNSIKLCGGPNEQYIQPYCVDEFSIVSIDAKEIPANTKTIFGKKVTPEQAAASWTAPVAEKYDAKKEAQYRIDGLVINQDADGFVRSCQNGVTLDGLKNFAYQFKDSHITDYVMCVNNTNATYPSEYWTSLLDKYHQKEENGVKVNYSKNDIAKGAYQIYEVLGEDYIAVWTDVFKEIGINPWISFRMNDAHDLVAQKTSVLFSEFFHEHAEYRRVQHHASKAYYDNCNDYTHEGVREHMLALIKESLERYDMYGIELDFQREIWLFKIGGEYAGVEIMNQFMRDVKELVETYEKERGHAIKIAVRVAPDFQTNFDFGLNVMQWASEGLINIVIPTSRWVNTYTDIPVLMWNTVLEPLGVELWAGIEGNMTDNKGHTLETLNGVAANFYSQGADKIYLFNHMLGYDNGDVITEEEKVYVAWNMNGNDSAYWQKITTLGSAEKVMNVPRRLILTYNETLPLWKTVNTTKLLPKNVNGGGSIAYLRIPVGEIPEGSDVTVKFGASVSTLNPEYLTVYVNSVLCDTFLRREFCDGGYTSNLLYCYDVPEEAWSGYLTVELSSQVQSFTVDHLEVTVTPAEAES